MPRQIIKFGQVSENRKARFAYSIDDTIEAGISLTGAEIKSLRYGLVTIVDGFVQRRGDNLFLAGVEIQKLPTANRAVNFDERRQRQLLLHRNQINRLIGKLQERGATIVPLKLYFNNRGKLKVLLGIGYGKNKVDKRETIKERDLQRRINKGIKTHIRGFLFFIGTKLSVHFRTTWTTRTFVFAHFFFHFFFNGLVFFD